jgi:hypothetical protein
MALMLEELGGDQSCLAGRTILHAHRGPLDRLLVQILQALKTAARQEVGLDCPEASFLPGFSVRMADRMAEEREAVVLGERGHLRHDHRLLAAAAQTCQVGVVDDALLGRVAPEHQRFVQEALHGEAVECPVELQVPPLRVPQVQEAGDDPRRLARQFHLVNRGVVLHLDTRFVRHVIAAGFGGLAQPQLPHRPRQGGIADLDPFFLHQDFVDALHPAVALLVQAPQQLRIDVDLVFAHCLGQIALLANDRAHRPRADVELPTDLVRWHAGQV